MDVAFILDKYFKGTRDVSIDVFDAQTLNTVYRDHQGRHDVGHRERLLAWNAHLYGNRHWRGDRPQPGTKTDYDVETSGMFCLSGGHSGDADEAAHARELEDEAWNVIFTASLIDDD